MEFLKVHKRDEKGKLQHIGEYSNNDLLEAEKSMLEEYGYEINGKVRYILSVEDFIFEYVLPKFGPGQYQLTAITETGREVDAGCVTMSPEDYTKSLEKKAHWLTEEEAKELGEPEEVEGALQRYKDKWYFTNEVQSELNGPYQHRELAALALKKYAETL